MNGGGNLVNTEIQLMDTFKVCVRIHLLYAVKSINFSLLKIFHSFKER